MRILARIAVFIQALELLEERVVAEKRCRPIALKKLSLSRTPRKIVNENRAWLSGPQEIECQPESAKIFRTVDQNCVTGLQTLRQDFARVAIEKLYVSKWSKLVLGCGSIFRISIEFDADDPRLRKAVRENQGAFTAGPARFQNLFWRE